MADSATFGIGLAQGLDAGVRRYKADMMLKEDRDAAERLRDEEAEQRRFERSRQMAADARADEQYSYEKGQRGTRERAAQISLDSAQEGLDTQRQSRQWAIDDRPAILAERKLETERRSAAEKREQGRFDMSKQTFDLQVKEMQDKMKDEGFEDLISALERGADPEYAFQKFNSQGKLGIRPGTGRYDPKTRTISGVTSNGKPFNGSLDSLKALLPPKPAGKTEKLGEGDRLVRTAPDGTVTDVTPKPANGGRGGTASQYRNKFNWQTHINQAEDQVFKVMGGNFNTLTQKYDPPEGGGDKVGLAQQFVGVMGRQLEEAGIPIESGELGNIAGQIVRDTVLTYGDAEEEVRADPKFKNSGDQAVREEAQKRVKYSKVAARQQLEQEMQNILRQTQQQELERNDLPAPAASKDIKDPQTQSGPPDVKMLRPDKIARRKDGTMWMLINGQAAQVDESGRPIATQPGGGSGRW